MTHRLGARDASAASVMIADDDDDIRALVSLVLQRAGWSTTDVADGLSVLAALDLSSHAAFVLDIQMPGLSGTRVCRALKSREATRAIPVVLMSADTSAENLAAAHDAGCDQFLTKPFTNRQLLTALGGSKA